MSHLHRLLRCDKGTAAVEFAFIGLLLFTVTIGIIEVGRALFLLNELSHAADRASRAVLLNFTVSETDLTNVVRNAAFLTGLVPDNVVVASPAPTPLAPFRNVSLSYPFTPILTGFTIDAVTLSTDRQVAR